MAQEAPKAELGLDYSFARYNPSAAYTKGHSLNGGGGNLTINFTNQFGIRMDLQGYQSTTNKFVIPPNSNFPGGATGTASGDMFTYLFGPVFKIRRPKAEPFFDVLVGGAHNSVYANAYTVICQPVAGGCKAAGSPNGDAFAMSMGGGIDIPIGSRMRIQSGRI